jgi:hypothetical protein
MMPDMNVCYCLAPIHQFGVLEYEICDRTFSAGDIQVASMCHKWDCIEILVFFGSLIPRGNQAEIWQIFCCVDGTFGNIGLWMDAQ